MLNLVKTNFIVNGEKIIPDPDGYVNCTGARIFRIQTDLLDTEEWMYVLNTSVFVAVDYSPSKILEEMGLLLGEYTDQKVCEEGEG